MNSGAVSELLMNEGVESLEEIAIFLCLNQAKTLSQIHEETRIDKTMIDLFCAARPKVIERFIDGNGETRYKRTACGEELFNKVIDKAG